MNQYEEIVEFVKGLDVLSTGELKLAFNLSFSKAFEYHTQLIMDGHLKSESIIECKECGTDLPEFKYNGDYYCSDCMLAEAGVQKVTFTDFYYADYDGDYLGSSEDYSENIVVDRVDGEVLYCEYGFEKEENDNGE